MAGPQLVFIGSVAHISVSDAILLARMAHDKGANLQQYANTLETLVKVNSSAEDATTPGAKPKPQPKKKEKNRARKR